MFFADEVESHKLVAEARARDNTLAFFDKYDIDRRGAEQMLARLCPQACDVYYVSTVPAGLAGSKSDLDVILMPAELAEFENLTSMLFYAGRRVGAKIIPASAMAKALEALHGLTLGRALVGAEPAAFASLKWIDIERLINGISFDRGAYFLPGLNDAAAYAVAMALANYRRSRMAAKLALHAGADGAANGYLIGAVVSAMDALMSACGRISASSKWVLERWSRFEPCAGNVDVTDGIRVVTAAWRSLTGATAKSAATLASIDALFDRLADANRTRVAGLRLSPHAVSAAFLPGAVCIKGAGRATVVSSRVAEMIDTFDEERTLRESSAADVGSLLSLFQLELVDIDDHGANP